MLFTLCALWASAALAGAPPPWEGAPFSASGKAMAQAAAALPAPAGRDADVEVLLEDVTLTFDGAGAHDSTTRVVFRTLTQAGAESWATVGAEWSPWLEDRPQIRARVIAPDGTEHPLDPATLSEESEQASPESFSDRKAVRGPLPAMAAGVVVEEQITTRHRRPAIGPSERDTYYFGGGAPTRLSRWSVDLPAKLPFRYALQGTGAAARATQAAGRQHVAVELRDLPAMKAPERAMPPEVVPQARITFGTARSWNEVASAYAEVVDRQVASAGVAEQAKKLAAGEKAPRAVADRMLAWLRKSIRYTGVELAEAAVVPRPPPEVLARGYGDCKDLSALMVAMLRSVGVPAHVALLSPGWSDAPPDVPGFGLFNHAIVVVPGKEPLWMDPTDWSAPSGQLPPLAYGRQALVAARDTQGLTRTPPADPSRNVFRVTREYLLAERGRGRLVESTSTQGTIAADRRDHLRRDADDFRQSAEEYLEKFFEAERLSDFAHSDPDDVSGPLTVRLEAEGIRRAYAADVDAAVSLTTGILFEHLPRELAPLEEPPADEDARAALLRAESRRKYPLRVPEPYSAELTAVITPAPGFTARALPAGDTVKLGPATLKRAYAQGADGKVTARFSFDLTRVEMTAGEVEELRRALGEYLREPALQLLFDRVPEKLLSAGKVKEAMEEQRKLIALHPREALHHAQLALLLLRAGAAGAARDEARAATAMEPALSYAWRVLGIALAADDLGRELHRGADVAGAVTALRKAKELDPRDVIPRERLAGLLVADPTDLRRFGPRADLAGAILELEALRKELGNRDSDDDYLEALFNAERFKDARKAAASMQPSVKIQALSLASLASLEGGRAAIAEAGRTIAGSRERRSALAQAAGMLLGRRRYPEAAALFGELVSGAENPAALQGLVDTLQRVKRHEAIALKPTDPTWPLQKLMALVSSHAATEAAVLRLLARNALPQAERPAKKGAPARAEKAAPSDVAEELRRVFGASGFDVDIATDLFFGAEAHPEGNDASGYRVELSVPAAGTRPIFVVVKEGGELRLLADSSDLSPLGAEALARARKGDLPGARRMLDWARREQPQDVDRLPPAAAPFPSLWTVGAGADAARVKAAAAALMATGRMRLDAEGPLREAREKAPADVARALDWAQVNAHLVLERWAELLADTERLGPAGDHPNDVFRLRALALRKLHRLEEAEKLARERLELRPEDLDAQEMVVTLAADRGDFAAADAAGRKIIDAGRANNRLYNNLAWYALFRKDAP
ncbi:MAG TPA: DUF3857 domain-containing protein, partial [Myxococcales bacterium]|nr:DUF3857 domain-containing protein [Myxococcales bacterium]